MIDISEYIEEEFEAEYRDITAALDRVEALLSPDNTTLRAIERYICHDEQTGDRALIVRYLLDLERERGEALRVLHEVNPQKRPQRKAATV